MPALNPVSTGSEIRLATAPRRRMPASSRKPPTSSDRVVATAICVAASAPAANWLMVPATRMAMVEVVVTLSTRAVPNRA